MLLLHEDVGENYDAVARSAAAAVGAETCQLALYDAETDELIARRPNYSAAARSIPQYRFPITLAPASAHVVRTGEAYLSNDPGHDPFYDPSVRERGVHSVLTVPVRHGGRILGLLYALNKPGGFVPDDVRTLTALAGAAAVTIENIRLYVEERDRRMLSEGLREVSRALVGTLSEQAALSTVLDQMWRVIRYQAAVAVVLEGRMLRVAASRGGEPEGELALEQAGDLRAALLTRRTTVLSDAATRLPRLGLRGVAGRALAAPLLTRDEVRGAIVAVFDPEQAPRPRDEQIVGAFAGHAALFLEAGALLRKERQARARATAVARITRMAASRHEPESLLQAVAPELMAASAADRVILYLKLPRTVVLSAVAWAGTTPEEEERLRQQALDPTSSLLAAILKGAPVFFQDEDNPPPVHLHPFGQVSSLLILPLAARDHLMGAVSLVSLRRNEHFDAALIDFLGDVAQQVALGVENARLFAALSQMASTDELTQLANRRRFTEALRRELGRARRTGLPLSLILVDVDHLKKVNDTFGHPAGDSAIRHVAGALREGRRDTDVVARFGGEEFALLLPGTDHAGAVKAAERVRERLDTTVVETVGQVTASMGVATWPQDGATEERLVWVADQRLYTAKEGGRNRVAGGAAPPEVEGGGTASEG
ncbi:MAG TPA: diguanylate cyclase [Vicinamibacteria bacterium]|nr:diguanylate cyclase [Vicinamibacteria bacterium]